MESLKSNTANITKLVDFINDFYEEEHMTKDWAIVSNKPNIARIRFLLDGIINGQTEDFSLSDKKAVMKIFTYDMMKYIKKCIEIEVLMDNRDFLLFIEDFIIKIDKLIQEIIKWDVLSAVRLSLKSTLGEPIAATKAQIEKGWSYKVDAIVGKTEEPIFLIKKKKWWELFFIDVKKNTIVQECGNKLEKAYFFADEKFFIFNKSIQRNKTTLKNEATALNAKNSDATIKDFLDMLKQAYTIPGDITKLPIENWNVLLEQNLYAMMDDKTNILKKMILVLNTLDFLPNKKLIVFNTNQGKLINLGLYDTYEIPTKMKEWYESKVGIQIPVVEKGVHKIILTNGEKFEKLA